MSQRKPTSAPWIAAVVLLVLTGGYVGAYYVVVDSAAVGHAFDDDFVEILPTYPIAPVKMFDVTISRSHKSAWRPFFAPIHWLDRRIRPHVWTP